MHSTVLDNPFVGGQYVKDLKALKITAPYRYITGFLGKLGTLGERVMTNWRIENFGNIRGKEVCGLDFGYEVSFNAYTRSVIVGNKLYIYDEYYNQRQTNQELGKAILEKGYSGLVLCDSAEPKSIQELNLCGVPASKCRKPTIIESYKQLKSYEIIIHPRCKQLISEFESLSYEEKNGVKIEDRFTIDPHGIDSVRYAISYESTVNTLKGDDYNSINYFR